MGGVRQTEMHTAKLFVPQPSASEAEVATGNLRRYKSLGVDQFPVKLTGRRENVINVIWN
jgi:hypothetical protein